MKHRQHTDDWFVFALQLSDGKGKCRLDTGSDTNFSSACIWDFPLTPLLLYTLGNNPLALKFK